MKSDFFVFKSQLLMSFAASVRREASHQYILGLVAAFRQQYIFAAVPPSGYNCNSTLYSMRCIRTNIDQNVLIKQKKFDCKKKVNRAFTMHVKGFKPFRSNF